MSFPFIQGDIDPIIRDARSSEGKTPAERMAMFADLLATIDAVWQNLPPQERLRRQRIADRLDARPDPWWKNFRPEALEEDACNNSSH